jgi:hypothetical protein
VGRFGQSPPPCMGSMVQSAISLVGESNVWRPPALHIGTRSRICLAGGPEAGNLHQPGTRNSAKLAQDVLPPAPSRAQFDAGAARFWASATRPRHGNTRMMQSIGHRVPAATRWGSKDTQRTSEIGDQAVTTPLRRPPEGLKGAKYKLAPAR